MNTKKTPLAYRIIRWLVKLFYPVPKLYGLDKLPEDEGCVIVGNHSQMNGPIIGELYIPGEHKVWCAGQMMNKDEVADYAYKDFWSLKPQWTQPFYRLLSKLITPLSVLIFNNANTIAVYHDFRLRNTYRESVEALAQGQKLVIFPEKAEPYNNILYAFQDRFIDTARFYYKKCGKALKFIPMYIAPKRGEVYFGEPISFDPTAPSDEERARVCSYLMDKITAMAKALPKHTVVPYLNMAKKDYPTNI